MAAEEELNSFVRAERLIAQQELVDARQELEDLWITLSIADNSVDSYIIDEESLALSLNRDELLLLTSIDRMIDEQEQILSSIENERERIIHDTESEEQSFIITASIDGYINLVYNMIAGEFISGGQEIATIIPPSDKILTVEIAVPNQYIANISAGQEIDFNILALPYRDYGRVVGRVNHIGTDVRRDSHTGVMYFLVEAIIDNVPLVNHRGEYSEIQVGMLVEGRAITGDMRILTWFLDLINMWG